LKGRDILGYLYVRMWIILNCILMQESMRFQSGIMAFRLGNNGGALVNIYLSSIKGGTLLYHLKLSVTTPLHGI
jgi:hypothetical protein